jgi:hypothetical protein
MRQIAPSDVTGLAALNPGYVRAADRLAGLPPDQQLSSLMQTPGITPQTAMLIMKANLLRDILRGQPNQAPDPNNVAQDTDAKLQQAQAQANQQNTGIAAVEQPLFGQGFKAGGIIAFAGGEEVKANDPNAADPATFPQGNPEPNSDASRAAVENVFLRQLGNPYLASSQRDENPEPVVKSEKDAAPKVNDAEVGQLLFDALKGINVRAGGGGGGGIDPFTKGQLEINARRAQEQYETLRAAQDKLTPKDRSEYEAEYYKKAKENGMNEPEAERLLALAPQAKYLDEELAKIPARSYIAAGKAQLDDLYAHPLPGSGLQNALRGSIVSAAGQSDYQTKNTKAIMDAKQELATATYTLKDAVYKNKMGIIDKGDTAYENAIKEFVAASNRVDQVVAAAERTNTQLAAHEASVKQSSMMDRVYGSNPALIYQPALDGLVRQRAAAQAAHAPPEKIAALDEAIKQTQDLMAGAVNRTPKIVEANLREESRRKIADIALKVKLEINTLNDKQLRDLEHQIPAKIGEGDDGLELMRADLRNRIQQRLAELQAGGQAALGGGSSTPAQGTVDFSALKPQ